MVNVASKAAIGIIADNQDITLKKERASDIFFADGVINIFSYKYYDMNSIQG